VEKVEISKEELEKLQKKATDFDGIIEKKRLEKLSGKDKKPKESDENLETITTDVDFVTEIAREEARRATAEMLAGSNLEKQEENLKTAYNIFIRENNWADDDEVISAISKEFKPGTAVTVEDIVKNLDATAVTTFPDRYKAHVEEKIKAKYLGHSNTIDIGAAGSGVSQSSAPSTQAVEITDEDRRLAEKFFGGNMERYLKYRQNN